MSEQIATHWSELSTAYKSSLNNLVGPKFDPKNLAAVLNSKAQLLIFQVNTKMTTGQRADSELIKSSRLGELSQVIALGQEIPPELRNFAYSSIGEVITDLSSGFGPEDKLPDTSGLETFQDKLAL